MSAANGVMEARTPGIQLRVEGDDLVLEAGAPPSPVLEQLSRHMPAMVLWLRSGADGWSEEDWQAFFDERAGIAEFDGGQTREQAEAMAFECCVVEWLNHHPCRSDSTELRACIVMSCTVALSADSEGRQDAHFAVSSHPTDARETAMRLSASLRAFWGMSVID